MIMVPKWLKSRFWWLKAHPIPTRNLRTWQQTGNCDNGAWSKHSSGSARCHQLQLENDRGSVERWFDTRITEIPYNSWLYTRFCNGNYTLDEQILIHWLRPFSTKKSCKSVGATFRHAQHINSGSKGCQLSMHLVRWHTGSLRAGLPHFLLMFEETYWRVIWGDRWGAVDNGREGSRTPQLLLSFSHLSAPTAPTV